MMTPPQLHQHLAHLSHRRPVFNSEAEFQHELAMELDRSGYEVRLEVPRIVTLNGSKVRVEIDLLVKQTTWTAIELKYVKQATVIEHGGESFDLAHTWGTNLSRFDCLADVRRVEALVESNHAQRGFAIFMTNAPSAWQEDVASTSNIAGEFSIHDGRRLPQGQPLNWRPTTPPVGSVTSKRLHPFCPIVLAREQTCQWTDYSNLNHKAGGFRYLLLSAT